MIDHTTNPSYRELVDWANQNIATGSTRESLRVAAINGGHNPPLVNAVLDACFLPNTGSFPIPWPDTSKMTASDGTKDVKLLLIMSKPKIVLFENFISSAEADELVEQARPKMTRSTGLNAETGLGELTEARTSKGAFFDFGQTPLIASIEQRIATLVNWPVENGEGMQVLSYVAGQEYIPHHDWFDPSFAGNQRVIERGGNRVGTFLIYLKTPEEGGDTTFNDVGLSVRPQKGNAVLFSYEIPHASTLTLHAGAPVISGEKVVATKWLRERKFK